MLDKEHPETLVSMNNLEGMLRDQGKYEQTEEMHRQTLGLKNMMIGEVHPSTLMSMNNLGLMLSDQSKYKQAGEMHRQAPRLSETVLSKEHPSTMASMNNLEPVLQHRYAFFEGEKGGVVTELPQTQLWHPALHIGRFHHPRKLLLSHPPYHRSPTVPYLYREHPQG